MKRALNTVAARRAKWQRDQQIRKAEGSHMQVAVEFGLLPSTIRDIRSGRR